MDSKPSWIDAAAGTLLCAFAGLLLLVLIAHWAQLYNRPEMQTHYVGAEVTVALRLLH